MYQAAVQAERDAQRAQPPKARVLSSAPSFAAASPAQRAKDAPLPDFPVGCRVEHRAFGSGMVTSVKPMGGDALLEIAFDQKGTKRLMAKSASQFMQRI